jgi:hypothetical protein
MRSHSGPFYEHYLRRQVMAIHKAQVALSQREP